MFILQELSDLEITGAVGGSVGGALLITKIIFEIWKMWKKHRDENKTAAEAVTLILKSINFSKKKPRKIKKNK